MLHDSTSTPANRNTSSTIIIACLVYALLAGVYWLTFRGSIFAYDELITFSSIESLVKQGDTSVNQVAFLRSWLQWSLYSKYDPAQALLGVPFFWLAMHASFLDNVQMVMTLNIVLVALAGALVFMVANNLGYGHSISVLVALLFGLATGAWPASKSFFSEPLTMASMALAAYGALRFRQTASWLSLALCWFSLALALANRSQNVVALPAFALYCLWAVIVHPNPTTRKPLRLASYALLVVAPLALWAASMLYYNAIRYGDPLSTGYGLSLREATSALEGSLRLGLIEHLIGPAHGLFLYSPILLAALPGLVLLQRQHRAEAALIMGITVSYVLFHGLYGGSGGWVWGHRYLLVLCPLLALSLAPIIESLRNRPSRILTALFVILIIGSVAVQLLAVTLDHSCCNVQDMPPGFTLRTYADERFSWLAAAIAHWPPVGRELAWLASANNSSSLAIDYLPLALTLLWIAAAGVGLIRALSQPATLTRKKALFTVASILAVTWVLGSALLFAYGRIDTQQKQEALTFLTRIAARARPGEPLVMVAPKPMHVSLLFGLDDGRQRYVGMDFEQPLDPKLEEAIGQELDSHARLWMGVHGRWPNAPDNGVEKWLDRNACPVRLEWVDEFGYFTLYSRSQPDSVQANLPSAVFANVARLEASEVAPIQVRPGDLLCVTLTWQPLATSPEPYKVFVQVIDPDGRWIAGNDRPLAQENLLLAAWHNGQAITERYGIELPDALAEGDYFVWIGIYDPLTDKRVPVGNSDHIEIDRVMVIKGDINGP